MVMGSITEGGNFGDEKEMGDGRGERNEGKMTGSN